MRDRKLPAEAEAILSEAIDQVWKAGQTPERKRESILREIITATLIAERNIKSGSRDHLELQLAIGDEIQAILVSIRQIVDDKVTHLDADSQASENQQTLGYLKAFDQLEADPSWVEQNLPGLANSLKSRPKSKPSPLEQLVSQIIKG